MPKNLIPKSMAKSDKSRPDGKLYRIWKAQKICEKEGHLPFDGESVHPFYPSVRLYSGTRYFNGVLKMTYPCSRCGAYLSEDEVEVEEEK